ncbi:helix-turn-helix domain-containing protein [Bacillus cereus]|uniref:helix-turn-helix domain-containing protein n=1 Tax=Bacillus cereus TaxID=1396 RepID=UPI0015970D71|nr:helix-turn-helix transcriptional regulator [Bacillus cereus]
MKNQEKEINRNNKRPLNLKVEMELHNQSSSDLAEILDVSPQSVNGWLSGRKNIAAEHLETLVKIYGKPAEYLLAENEQVVAAVDLFKNNVIALQPTRDPVAQKNYEKTIINSIKLEDIKPHLNTSQYEELQKIYPDGNCYIWGVKDGKNSVTKKQFDKLNVSDTVLFYQAGLFYSKALITFLTTSTTLSLYLWNDELYKNIYFVTKVEAFNLAVEQFNKFVYGREKKFPLMGFRVLDREKSLQLLLALEIIESEYILLEESDSIDAKNLLEDLLVLEEKESLNSNATAQGRLEQSILRKILFGNRKTAKCACCKKEFPVSYLVTAHIKKRKFASKEERLDPNIVFPLCSFGCDAAFEKGDIFVEDGVFRMNQTANTPYLAETLKHFHNQPCDYYNDNTERFYTWHKHFHVLNVPTK